MNTKTVKLRTGQVARTQSQRRWVLFGVPSDITYNAYVEKRTDNIRLEPFRGKHGRRTFVLDTVTGEVSYVGSEVADILPADVVVVGL